MLQFEIGSRPLPNAHLRKVAMPRPWRMSCFVAGLIAVAAVSGSDAKVLRTKGPASTVWVFKNADALRRFERVAQASVYDEGKSEPLLAKVPQGSKIVVLAAIERHIFGLQRRRPRLRGHRPTRASEGRMSVSLA